MKFSLHAGSRPFIAMVDRTDPPLYILTSDPAVDEFVSRDVHRFGSWDPHVLLPFEFILGDRCQQQEEGSLPVVVDGGANLGLFGLVAANRGCRVIAFEVQREMADLASSSAIMNGFTDRYELVDRALSDTDDKRIFLSEPRLGNLGGRYLVDRQVTDRESVEKESVGTVRLGTVLDGKVGPAKKSVLVMKLDVEGHELPALKGAGAWLDPSRINNLLVEVTREHHGPVFDLLLSSRYCATPLVTDDSFAWSLLSRRPKVYQRQSGTPTIESKEDLNEFLSTQQPFAVRMDWWFHACT